MNIVDLGFNNKSIWLIALRNGGSFSPSVVGLSASWRCHWIYQPFHNLWFNNDPWNYRRRWCYSERIVHLHRLPPCWCVYAHPWSLFPRESRRRLWLIWWKDKNGSWNFVEKCWMDDEKYIYIPDSTSFWIRHSSYMTLSFVIFFFCFRSIAAIH